MGFGMVQEARLTAFDATLEAEYADKAAEVMWNRVYRERRRLEWNGIYLSEIESWSTRYFPVSILNQIKIGKESDNERVKLARKATDRARVAWKAADAARTRLRLIEIVEGLIDQ